VTVRLVDVERDEDGEDMAEQAAVGSSGELAALTSRCSGWITAALQMHGNEPKRSRNILHDKLSIQPHHTKPEALEHRIPPGVSGTTASVKAAIDFNDEPPRGSDKVSDVPSDDDLPAKRHTELSVDDRPPEPSFGSSGSRAHGGSASSE
jgi:hypothetical protein